jgi:hypothetical protein
MPKSGPKELLAYHLQQLNKERKTMSTATSFDTEKLDDEALAAANARLASMPNLQVKPIEPTPTLHANHGHPNPPAAPAPAAKEPEPEARRQRMTVGRLAQKYQERITEITANLEKMESIVSSYQRKLEEEKCSLKVWQEALAEINAD